MTDMVQFSEEQTRADLAQLLTGAVEASGRTRCDIGRDAQIHKDALRRVLTGKRSATLGEASRILLASGVLPQQALTMFMLTNADQSAEWQGTEIGRFVEDFLTALPVALAGELRRDLAEPRRVTRLIRLPEVMCRVGLGRSTIYRWMSEGKFPRPVQLGGHSVAWVEEDVEAWVLRRRSL